MRPYPALPKTLASVLLGLVLGACGDSVTDPDRFADSADAEAVLRSAAALPALPALVEQLGTPPDPASRAVLLRASELWASGVTAEDSRAASRRRLAVRYAAPLIAARLTDAQVDATERGLREWSGTARSMLRHIELAWVATRLDAAERQLDRAARAPDPETRVQALLLAGSELIETTPRFVARTLAGRAETAVEAAAAGEGDGPELERAQRLKDWALRAVEEGDYLMAIQRAYYALQLVEAR